MSDSEQPQSPAIVREGSRWRYQKPTADEVANWFKTQTLDDGMKHEDYVAGVVIIPQSEKVKRQLNARGTEEVWEMTYTPYVRVDTRISYFRRLAALRGMIAIIEPAKVPRIDSGELANGHLPDGFFWSVMGVGASARRFLGARWEVALYDAREYMSDRESWPALQACGTKQVWGDPDVNALERVETGAIGRALGVAGILVIGTGIATAEDMQEFRESPAGGALASLPEAGAPEQTSEQLNEQLLALQGQLRPHEEYWRTFAAWWQERSTAEGWKALNDAPMEVRRGMVIKMEDLIAQASEARAAEEGSPGDSSPAVEAEDPTTGE